MIIAIVATALATAGILFYILKSKGLLVASEQEEKLEAHKPIEGKRIAAKPSLVKLGNTLWLEEFGDSYEVHAIECHVSSDDEWFEFKLVDPLSDKVMYLSCEEDDEDRWVWFICEDVDIDNMNLFRDVSYKGEKKPPKQSFSYGGKEWKYDPEEYNFKVTVTDELIDRPESKVWTAKVTEWYNPQNEYETFTLELWEGGRGATVGRPYNGKVSLLAD